MKTQHPIRSLCQALEVSASGYYDWCHRQTQPGPRAQENAQLLEQIIHIHQDSRETYGSPRIQVLLRRAGHAHGRNRIARLMRQQGLCGRAKGRFRVHTTDSNHDQPIAPNRLAELPAPSAPNQIWVGGHHLHPHRGGLALPGRRHGPLQPSDRRLGHGPKHRHPTGPRGLGHGADSSPAGSRAGLPLRPRLPIRQR